MSLQIPELRGSYRDQATSCRNQYIQFVKTRAFTMFTVSRLDVGVLINTFEKQLKRELTFDEKETLEDIFYDQYLEPMEDGWHIASKVAKIGYWACFKLTTTSDWYNLSKELDYFNLMFRCLSYHFKHCTKVKSYLETIPYRPPSPIDNWSV